MHIFPKRVLEQSMFWHIYVWSLKTAEAESTIRCWNLFTSLVCKKPLSAPQRSRHVTKVLKEHTSVLMPEMLDNICSFMFIYNFFSRDGQYLNALQLNTGFTMRDNSDHEQCHSCQSVDSFTHQSSFNVLPNNVVKQPYKPPSLASSARFEPMTSGPESQHATNQA